MIRKFDLTYFTVLSLASLAVAKVIATTENVNIEDRLKTLERKLEKYDSIEEELVHMEDFINNQTMEINDLKEHLDFAEKRCRTGSDVVHTFSKRIQNSGHSLRSADSENGYIEDGGPILFSLYLSKSRDHLPTNHMVPFDHVTTVEGFHFTGSDGAFICPRSGLYLFMWNIMSDARRHASVELRHNGVAKGWSEAGGILETHPESAGNHVILRLTSGDNVGLFVTTGRDHGQIHSLHTTFSGLWLSP